jgi:hypothetical protein
LEAVTSRPLLLAAVGKASRHGGQMQLYLTPMHAKLKTIKASIVNIRAALAHVKAAAEQMPGLDRWATAGALRQPANHRRTQRKTSAHGT